MLFLKAMTTDGKVEYFNTQNILNITKHDNGNFKILMGAGLYWVVKSDSVEFLEMENIFNDKTI